MANQQGYSTDQYGNRYNQYGELIQDRRFANAEDIFTADALAKRTAQPNPFKPGTRQYADFQKEQIEQMKRMAGAPVMPDFVSNLGGDGKIKDVYKLNPGSIGFQSILPGVSDKINNVNIDKNALNAMKSRAMSQGNSPWLNLQLEKQGVEELDAVEKAKRQMAGNTAQAESALAMRGGLSSGARERLARSGASNSLAASQGIRRGGMVDRINLGIADDNTKMNLLSQLPGMEKSYADFELGKQTYLGDMAKQQQGVELDVSKYNQDQRVSADKYNIGNALNDTLQKRAYDLGKYNEMMKAWAADKTAEAQGGGGKK